MILVCETCKREFKTYDKKQKYCSRECMLNGKTYQENRSKAISEANKKAYAEGRRNPISDTRKAHEAVKKKSQNRFKTNPNMMIGKRGYQLIYVPQEGWVKFHHFVWKKAGREIPEGMDLHHINFDKLDNNLENLELIGHSEHLKLHYEHRNIDCAGRFI